MVLSSVMIYFVRHGESEANHRGVFAGQRDNSPLTHLGRQEAEEAAEDVVNKRLQFSALIHSPLDRAKTTAHIIADRIVLEASRLHSDDRLMEYDMGSFSGKPIHPITSQEITAHPETEDPHHFRQRILLAIEDAENIPGDVLLIAHDGVGRMLEAIRQGMDPMHFYDVKGYKNGEIIQLKLEY